MTVNNESLALTVVPVALLAGSGHGKRPSLFADLKNEKLGRLRVAEISEHAMNVHRRLVEKFAGLIFSGRFRIHLILDLAFQQIGKNRSGVLVRLRVGAGSNGERKHRYLWVGHFSQRVLHQRVYSNGVHAPHVSLGEV